MTKASILFQSIRLSIYIDGEEIEWHKEDLLGLLQLMRTGFFKEVMTCNSSQNLKDC